MRAALLIGQITCSQKTGFDRSVQTRPRVTGFADAEKNFYILIQRLLLLFVVMISRFIAVNACT